MIMPKEIFDASKLKKYHTDEEGNIIQNIMGVVWFTNIDHGRRHEPLPLMTMEDKSFIQSTKKYVEKAILIMRIMTR